MNSHLVELVLTCSSWQEAQRIADALLEKRLVTSVETFEIRPTHWWASHSHTTHEVRLIVLGHHEDTDKIKAQAAKLKRINTKPILLTELTK